jgi:3-oxoacyl-[acyl-carrier protein] reductase
MSDAQTISLKGKVAIITGAGGGFGSAMAVALARAGATIAGVDVKDDGLKALRDKVPATAGGYLPVTADITSASSAEEAVGRVVKEFGRVDILVNNAGLGGWVSRPANMSGKFPFWEATLEGFHRTVGVNFLGAFHMARIAIRSMLPRNWGRIVNVTTSLDSMMRGMDGAYGPAKAGLEAMSACWAEDVAGTGVNVNILVPGGSVHTGLMAPGTPQRSDQMTPDVMMGPIPWLASERSNAYNGRRFIAATWDATLPPDEAGAKIAAPMAWREEADRDAEARRLRALARAKGK